jgi:hypothetical protein
MGSAHYSGSGLHRVQMTAKKRVLIFCIGNSARSQMAEGLLRHDAGAPFDVESAGTSMASGRTKLGFEHRSCIVTFKTRRRSAAPRRNA